MALISEAEQQQIAEALEEMLSALTGSADLAGSNLTMHAGSVPVTRSDASGNYIYYGVREFAMAAMMNGMSGMRRP